MALVVFSIAIIGIGGMTVLCPMLARFMWGFKRAGQMTDWLAHNFCSHKLPSKIAICIPAHNEQATVETTLQSIWASVTYAKSHFPELEVHISLRADGCSDHTGKKARIEKANVIEAKRKGKWKTLLALVRQAPAVDWVIFADCGVQWPKEFLRDTLLHLSDPMMIGLAPRYQNPNAGLLETIAWGIETKLKELETAAGGPVSVHGATVAYRYKELKELLNSLGSQEWINDDIALPLLLRCKYPQFYIKYAKDLYVIESLYSSGTRLSLRQHLQRRVRMVRGNAQWVRNLLPSLWAINPIAAVISMRRLFRMFWGYWVLAIVACLNVTVSIYYPDLALALFFSMVGLVIFASVRMSNLMGAMMASFLAPFYLFQSNANQSFVWR